MNYIIWPVDLKLSPAVLKELNWIPKGKGPMNSVLSVSPFFSSIFFSESTLRIFTIFCMNLGDNMGLKPNFSKKCQFS